MKKRWICGLLVIAMLLSTLPAASVKTEAAQQSVADMQISDAFVDVLKTMEGFAQYPYWDYSQWTVGYGTRCPDDKLAEYKANGITVEEAEALLFAEMVDYEMPVKTFAQKYDLTFTQNEYDALVSFTYNVGGSWIRDETGYLHMALRAGDRSNALIYGLCLWSTAGGDYILAMRRLCEANMFINGVYKAYNTTESIPDTLRYVFLDGNGGTLRYSICGYNAADPVGVTASFTEIPTGVDENGEPFVYEFAGWYTQKTGGTEVKLLDGSLANKTILYARWKNPNGEIEAVPEPESTTNLELTVSEEDGAGVYAGPGTYYEKVGTLAEGDKLIVDRIHKVGSYRWGRTESGWVSLKYTTYTNGMEDVETDTSEYPRWGTVTGDVVNTRSGPGTSYDKVSKKYEGDRVQIFEEQAGGSHIWGRMEDGTWIAMTYVELDPLEDEEVPPTLTSVEVIQGPDKTEYVQKSELLNLQGSVLKLNYSDGSIGAMSVTQDMITYYSNNNLGRSTVVVEYEGLEATFTVTIIKATVTFLNYDGTLLSQTQYAYGETVAQPQTPVKPADKAGEYRFVGWDKEVTTCAGNAIYTAVFERIPETVTITSIAVQNVPSKKEYVQKVDTLDLTGGTILITYSDGSTVTADMTGGMVSGFDNSELGTNTLTVTYGGMTANFTVSIVKATVVFKNYDGTVISSTRYAYGETVNLPADPVRPADGNGFYKFAGWDKKVTACKGNAEYTAVFEYVSIVSVSVQKAPDKKEYIQKVDALDLTGGTILVTYSDGSTVTADMTADMASGFDNSALGANTITVTYKGKTATFDVTIIKATVVFKNYDGTVISSAQYAYGETVKVPADPTRPADKNGPYTFVGWDKKVTACNGNAEYVAQYQLKYAYGDCNFDGKVNEDDAIYLLRSVLFPEKYPVEVWVDYNADSKVNEDDAIYLLRHVLFPEKYPLKISE